MNLEAIIHERTSLLKEGIKLGQQLERERMSHQAQHHADRLELDRQITEILLKIKPLVTHDEFSLLCWATGISI